MYKFSKNQGYKKLFTLNRAASFFFFFKELFPKLQMLHTFICVALKEVPARQKGPIRHLRCLAPPVAQRLHFLTPINEDLSLFFFQASQKR